MTVATSMRRIQYALDGATTGFPVPFPFPAADALQVIRTSAAGVDTLLALNVDYTVAEAPNQAGGMVHYPAAGAAGERLTIKRIIPRTQLVDYVPNDPFPADTHERALDKLTMIAQEDADELQRALTVPDTDPARGQMLLPPMPGRAGKIMAFDAAGKPVAATAGGSDSGLRADLGATGGAALVGYPGGTVHDRLQKLQSLYIDPRDFGVVEGSASDQASQVQAALNAAVAEGIPVVRWPASVRAVVDSAVVVIPSGVQLVGEAQSFEYYPDDPYNTALGGTLIRTAGGVAGPILEVSTSASARGLYLFHQRPAGNGANQGLIRMGPASYTSPCYNAAVADMYLYGHEINNLGAYVDADSAGIYLPPADTGSNIQRYFNSFDNIWMVNLKRGFSARENCNGNRGTRLTTRQVYHPFDFDGGASETYGNVFSALTLDNIGFLPSFQGAVFKLRKSTFNMFSGFRTECYGQEFDMDTASYGNVFLGLFNEIAPGTGCPPGNHNFREHAPFYRRDFWSLSQLRAMPRGLIAFGDVAYVRGQNGLGDGGGGMFAWDATSNAADDNNLIINPTGNAGAGRWIRFQQGFFGSAPPGARVTLPAAATDLASVIALANAIRTDLQNLRLAL